MGKLPPVVQITQNITGAGKSLPAEFHLHRTTLLPYGIVSPLWYCAIPGKSVLLWNSAVGLLLEAKVVEHEFVITPVCLDLYPALQIDAAAEELFAIGAGCAGDLFQHRAALSDDHSLVALPLAVNVHVDVHKVCTGALFEALDHDRDAVRDLVPHIKQCLFPDNFRHKLLFGHIGVSVIVKIVRAFHCIAAQSIE